RLNQVFYNLLTNAIKFSYPGTTINLTCKIQGESYVVAVTDTGVGIEKNDLEKIFQPFYVGAKQATSGETSTGLGLAISKRIVQAHGGTIAVSSQVGHG